MSQKIEQLTLSNGIPLILQQYDGSAAATYWWIQTGSADEAPKEAGFAHFLEHMLFKDAAAKETGKASIGKMARAIESLGGDINAYTSFDQTVYHVTSAAQHWEKVIDAFGAMAKPQRFLKSDFDREREVILEELKKNEDSPARQLFQALFSATYSKHPYGRPVIGFSKILRAARLSQLESFYRRNYTADRMGVILVGPVAERRERLVRLAEKHFGKKVIPARKSLRLPRAFDPLERKGPSIEIKNFDVKTPTVAFSFRVPDLKHEDMPALDIASNILAMGELGRLYQRLFYQESIVTDVSGGLYVPSDPGMLYFQAETEDTTQIPTVLERMFEELVRLRDQGPTEEELRRCLVNSESERLYATQSADGLAGRVGFLRFVMGDLEFDRKFLEELRAVDGRKIKIALEKYADFAHLSVVIQLPKGQTMDILPIRISVEKHLSPIKPTAPKIRLKQSIAERPPCQVIQRPSGLKVLYRERPSSHVMSIHAAVLGGVRMELGHPTSRKERDWGSSTLMSMSWTKGSRTRGPREIASIVEGSAAGFDGYAGRNTVGVQMTALARDWEKLSEVYLESFVEPTFPEDEIEHSRRVAQDNIRTLEDHSSQLCSKIFLENLFERHPYGSLTTGSLESLGRIDSHHLKSLHRAWMRADRLVVSVSGNVSASRVEIFATELERKLNELRSAEQSAEAQPISFPASFDDEPELKSPRWVERILGREQLHIIVGGLGSKLNSKDRYPLSILNNILGGQSGRLFIELREKKSLAYTVSPIQFDGMERGFIGTYIACSPSKREESIAGIRDVLARLAEKGPSAQEMVRAKEYYLGRRAMDLQGDSSIATQLSLEAVYGLPLLSDAEMARVVHAVTPKQVQEICGRLLVHPHQVTAVVG